MKCIAAIVAAGVLLTLPFSALAQTAATGSEAKVRDQAGNRLTLVSEGKSDYVIVVSHQALPATMRGAAELQKYLMQMSGAELLIADDSHPLPDHAILVGPSKYTPPLESEGLGDEGFIIRARGAQLIIAGPGPRGTMYGCSSFLESLGVRWFTSKVTQVPKRSTITLASMDVRQIPAFEYREPFFFEAFEKEWAARNKTNGHSQYLDVSTGGRVVYSEFVHTFDLLVPQGLYGAHPEYFPMVDGKRINGYVQRCLTNPDVLALAIAGVKKSFQDHPDATICSVSQNDCAGWCQCDQCRKLTDQYGAHSGLYLWFVNQVAEAIEKEMPDKLIDTLAYQFTEAPPKGIAPRKNVRVRLCPISVCESHPYEQDDHPATRAFVASLAAWSKITDSLYIWHYNTDFAQYLMPFADFVQLPDSLRLYKRSGVKGVFFEGDYAPGGGGSDAELRSYVMAKLMWDPSQDGDALIREWMGGVYGEASKPMRQWFEVVQEQYKQRHLGIYDSASAEVFTPEVIATGDAMFAEAAKLAKTPLEREYVAKAHMPLRFVKLFVAPSTVEEVNAFIADAKAMGITQMSEGGSVDQWDQILRQRVVPKK